MRKMDPALVQWDTTAELLATLIEVVDRGDRWFVEANTRKGSPQPDPIVIQRPSRNGHDRDRPRVATAAEMKAFFGGAVQYTP